MDAEGSRLGFDLRSVGNRGAQPSWLSGAGESRKTCDFVLSGQLSSLRGSGYIVPVWVTGEDEHAGLAPCSSGDPIVASVSRPVVGLDVGTGGPPVSGGTSQGIELVASIMARTVWETLNVANPAVIWGVPLGVAAAGVGVVTVVISDAVPAVVVTTGKITQRLNRLG